MRLDRLDLTRYGRFTDAYLDFLSPTRGAPDLHVIFGPNEAGKSTLFSAWLDLLYGIPVRTRYDFLHAGPTMQIGAKLTHSGGVLEAVRVKRNGPTLQDASGQALPEAVMQAALAGLGREGYAAMFSLDDDTLEQGGDSILASRGDLGEMLFAASAGLAGLGPQLEAVRKELDAFHKPRARNSTLKVTKDRLHELDRQRRELDITASAAQKLQRDLTTAEKAWASARQSENECDVAVKANAAALAVLPQQAKLARLKAEIEPLANFPEATEADVRTLQEIEMELHGLKGQIATRAETLAELDRRKANVLRDEAIFPLADLISEATGLHPLHLAALADLPRRRDRLSEVMADLAREMQALGLAGAAEHHIIAPAPMARLRALATKRDVVLQALGRAQDEVFKAKNRLAVTREKLGDPAPAADLQSLAHLVARLRQTDPEAQKTRAEQDLVLRNSELSNAMIALAPWSGAPQDLVKLKVPAPWQISAWEAADQTTNRTLRDAREALDRRKRDLATAQRGASADVGAAPSLTEAIDARQHREAAWAAHLARLAPDTAATFETALRHDDRITLHLAEATAAAKLGAERASALAQITDEVAKSTAEFQRQQAERQALEQAVAECATELGLDGAGIADLKAWLALREKALMAIAIRDQAQETLTRADTSINAATGHLAEALSLAPEREFLPLWSEALARLDTASQQQDAARQLSDLTADLNERTADLTAAKLALENWREDWVAVSTGTPLAEVAEDDMGLAALLDGLDNLSRLEIERAELADRVAKMESNSRSFLDASGIIFAALSLPATTAWASLGDRLIAAHQAERDYAQILADLARELEAQDISQAKKDALAAKRTDLGNRFEWTGDGSLSDHLSACLRANRLRRDIAEFEADLARHPAPLEDAGLLEANAIHLQDALTLARADSETRLAELTETRRLLLAVGGDDAVARIVAERANLLNELAEQTRAHLAQRFGLMAFEQGLRRYRDSHRSAMLARASDAFRQLSGGAYTGLAAQPEGTSEILVALPAEGGSKLATDLSKGTRFQLYLALRIAGYHELAKSRPPVPFIADDIMETFDDVRAEQAFGLLGDMAHKGQVIYLTHHQHLCDIAVAACPGARLVDLRNL
jgi:uncharacterized protein YhaN